jgi:uncharacterized protein
MLEIGKYNDLQVNRQVEFGYYLDAFDYGEVLLPNRYATKDLRVGDTINVIVYLDGEERLIATTERAYALRDEFAFLEVKDVNQFGAYCDWGLKKELFIPFAEQKLRLEVGRKYLVYIFLDDITERVLGTTKVAKFVDLTPPLFKEGQTIDAIIWSETDFAYKLIINNSHTGILYKNEVFKKLFIGQKLNVFIKKIREDLKIDLSLTSSEITRFDEFSELILTKLKEKNGFLKVTDNSPPELIYEVFGISKKNFKKAVGKLYKERIIMIHDDAIQLM